MEEYLDYLTWVARRIEELRIQKGVSAREMSLALGQSTGYINKIESGRALPSIPVLIYICEYFDITPQEFFNVESPAPQRSKELLREIEKLNAVQIDHLMLIVKDILGKK
jgi:transcriptional regulator with XRE-family HTH domain